MKRFLSFILLLAAVPLFAVTKNKSFPEYQFNKGIDSYHAPTALPQGYVQNSLNVLFDDVAPVTKRAGYTVAWSTKSYQYTGLWTYTDGTNTTWQIARSSDQITASNLAGTVVKIATVSVNNVVGETNAFGNAYFVDQTQGVYYWNGTATTYVSGSPQGSIITQFHNRLWVMGAAVPNGNQLYGSAYYSGTTWTTGLNPTDPVQYSIGLQDNFDNTTAEYVYLDTLYIFKHSSIFALYGFDQTSFQISQLTQECGCIDGASIQTYNSALEFVSLRGVESFNGYSCTRISDSIKNKIDPAIQFGGFSQQSWVQQNQTDWNNGTLIQTNASIASPALVLSTGTTTYSSGGFFSAGVTSNTYISGNVVQMSTDNVNVLNYSFESAFTSNDWSGGNGFQESSRAGSNCTLSPRTGSHMMGYFENATVGFTIKASVYDYNSNLIASVNVPWVSNSCTYASHTLSMSGNSLKAVFIQFTDTTNNNLISQTQYFLSNGSDITFYTASDSYVSVGTEYEMIIDDVSNGRSDIDLGSYQTPTYDTTFSQSLMNITTFYNQLSPTSSDGLFTPTYQTSSDGVSWAPNLPVGNNQTVNRYVRFVSTWSRADVGGANLYAQLASVGYSFTASTGSLRTQTHNMGSMSSWGNFSVTDALNSGSIAFSICSSSSPNFIPDSCSAQTPNSQITIATGTYVQWYTTFTVTASTQTPTLNSGTVQSFTGNKATPMSSTVWDNRYWLSLTTSTADTSNDTVLVLNKSGAWAPLDIHAGAFTQYKNNLYHADSLASGNIYLDNQGWADNGVAINAFINTRNEPLGDLASDDYMYALYPTAMATGNCPMTVQYSVDNSTTAYSLGSPLLSEFNSITSVRLPFPIDSAHQVFGQSVDFTLGTNDAQCGWQFLGIEGLYKQRPLQ